MIFRGDDLSQNRTSPDRNQLLLVCELRHNFLHTNYNLAARITFGGCCQWAMDAVRQTVERLYQPLEFDSLALRTSLDANVA